MPFGSSAFVGGIFNRSSARQQQKATERQFKHRYQWSMEDARKAGLNPMLVTGHGPGQSGAMAQAAPINPDFSGPVKDLAQGKLSKSQAKASDQQADTLKAQELQHTASAAEISARARVANIEAQKGQMVLNHWQSVPGLSSAAAFREAYGSGPGGQAMTLGAGFGDAFKTSLDRGWEATKNTAKDVSDAFKSSRTPSLTPKPKKDKKPYHPSWKPKKGTYYHRDTKK